MSQRVTDKPVLVTGASGWLASHIIYQLLDEGYTVRGTVRKLGSEKAAFLKTFHPKSESHLSLVECDLLAADHWAEAVEGCEYILHIASPFTFKYKNENELIEPAVKGVEHVFDACFQHAHTVKRIVQTSSVCSVVFGHPAERYACDAAAMNKERKEWNEACKKARYSIGDEREPDNDAENTDEAKKVDGSVQSLDPFHSIRTSMPVPRTWGGWTLMNENDWSVPDKIKGYEKSKVMAEKKAWEMVNKHNEECQENDNKVELVTMCPGFIFGPVFTKEQAPGESTAHVLRLLNRTFPFVPCINSAHVDVRDAATCHLLGMKGATEKVANRRFMVTNDDGNLDFGEQAELLARNVNQYGYCVPTFVVPKMILSIGQYVSSSAAAAVDKTDNNTYACNADTHELLGMTEWRTTESALLAHAISLAKVGLVKPKKLPADLLASYHPY